MHCIWFFSNVFLSYFFLHFNKLIPNILTLIHRMSLSDNPTQKSAQILFYVHVPIQNTIYV